MNPRIMDAVGLISRIVTDHWESMADQEQIRDELEHQGFSTREIADAFKWIERNTIGTEVAQKSEEESTIIRPPMRVLSPIEQSKLKPSAQGLLLGYYSRGLLDPVLLEDVLERIMRSDSEEVGDREVRRITALTLFNRVQAEWKDFLHSTNTLVH